VVCIARVWDESASIQRLREMHDSVELGRGGLKMNRLNHRDLTERSTAGPSIEYFKDTMASERASQQAFFVSAPLFAASTALTIVWCASMSAMGEMPMPSG
jgi:hypothetical protein